jgi:superfamily II DNA helicase RecQ
LFCFVEYVQEIGRAGRDGLHASANLYYNASDIARNILALSSAMRDYCTVRTCKRQYIANYFMYDLPGMEKQFCCISCQMDCE